MGDVRIAVGAVFIDIVVGSIPVKVPENDPLCDLYMTLVEKHFGVQYLLDLPMRAWLIVIKHVALGSAWSGWAFGPICTIIVPLLWSEAFHDPAMASDDS